MTRLVQLMVTGEIGEAEHVRRTLESLGIDATIEPADEDHPVGSGDSPQKVLVPESSLEAAEEAVLAMTDPRDELYDED